MAPVESCSIFLWDIVHNTATILTDFRSVAAPKVGQSFLVSRGIAVWRLSFSALLYTGSRKPVNDSLIPPPTPVFHETSPVPQSGSLLGINFSSLSCGKDHRLESFFFNYYIFWRHGEEKEAALHSINWASGLTGTFVYFWQENLFGEIDVFQD